MTTHRVFAQEQPSFRLLLFSFSRRVCLEENQKTRQPGGNPVAERQPLGGHDLCAQRASALIALERPAAYGAAKMNCSPTLRGAE
jgi:hypothetical protein